MLLTGNTQKLSPKTASVVKMAIGMKASHRVCAKIAFFLLILALLSYCAGLTPIVSGQSTEQSVVPKRTRRLSIDLSMSEDNNYDSAFAKAKGVGIDSVGLSFDWRDIEVQPNIYKNPYLKIADEYYPSKNVTLDLTLRPIHANRKSVPDDLAMIAWDSPQMIARFKALLDYVFSQTTHIGFSSIIIGSEINIYFPSIPAPKDFRVASASAGIVTNPSANSPAGDATSSWDQYKVFCKTIALYIKASKPNVKVGFEATYSGLIGPSRDELKALNEHGDVVGVSYYPINADYSVSDPGVALEAFQNLAAIYPGRKIAFYQLGYPSSSLLGSSEEKQAAFIEAVFRAWDLHIDQIDVIDFTFLTDCSEKEVADQARYFGASSERFGEFIRTLGLRRYPGTGTDKPSFLTLQREAKARGW